jgi:UDP-glucose 4-epimerase
MSVVVTGANGFIGTHTVKKLLEKGYHVKAVDLNTNKLVQLAMNQNLSTYQIDVTTPQFANILEPRDKVLHLAAVAHFVGREEANKAVHINVNGTINVLESCLQKDAERMVFSSTGSVYSRHAEVPIREDAPLGPSEDNYYGWSKLQAEQWIRIYQRFVPHVILRYAYVYGSDKDWGAVGAFLKKLGKGESPVVYGGNQTNDFVYVQDVVDANVLALETSYTNQAFNIGTGRATSIRDCCEYCIEALNSTVKPTFEPARTFDYPVFLYDISKANSLLNYVPKWNLLNGIKDMVATNKGIFNVIA